MLKNYFLVAWRKLRRNKTYSSVTIAGLAVGIAVALLIFLVISYEFSYDRFHSKKDRIYRVVATLHSRANGEVTSNESGMPLVLPDAMKTDFPGLEKIASVWNLGGIQVHVPIPGKDLAQEKRFKENEGMFFTEPALFDMFDFNWVAGNANALDQPNTAVLTESIANTYFGGWEKAMGQTIQIWSFRVPLRIVGVFKDLPANTDLPVRMGASYITFKRVNKDAFQNVDKRAWEFFPWWQECFVLRPTHSNIASLEAQLPAFAKKYFPQEQQRSPTHVALHFQPLTDIHLNPHFSTYKGDALTPRELWTLGAIGIFLLAVACINFINLSTAQSINRAREIGVRKVLGGYRNQLLKQFLHETGLFTLLSLLLGCFLARLALPWLSDLMHKPLTLNIIQQPILLVFLLATGIVVTFLAGLYPGMVLAGFHPIEAIKSRISNKTVGGVSLRRGLVVLQFVIAQLLIIGTIVAVQQMHFFRNRSLGFEKETGVQVELPSVAEDQLKYSYLKSQLLQVPGVEAASLCMEGPASYNLPTHQYYFDHEPRKREANINFNFADTSFTSTFHIGLAAGRLPYASDTVRELLVNETLVKKMGLHDPNEILGKTLSEDNQHFYPVVGVIHDFNSRSLRDPVGPLVMLTQSNAYNFIALRLEQQQMHSTLARVQQVFTQVYPTYIYDVTYLNERVAQFYSAEAMTSKLFRVFAALAIFISCLGLYGLVSFMAAQKTREVGIRKVLGASVQSIVYLFSREFTLLILVAFLIATPLGYYFMQQWLSGFYYHITIGWGVFALTMFLSIVIAWATVGYNAISAALANPVKSLRTE